MMLAHKYHFCGHHGGRMKLDDLAHLVVRARGSMGIRAAAREIGISPTTLSKIENGHVPDQATLQKVCDWIGEEVTKFTAMGGLQIAFKKNKTLQRETALSLANLIKRAEEQFKEHVRDVAGH
ncbi:MAG: helix-turn-helix transcriptional regulator [Rhizobiaceae bacterium]